MHFRRRTQAIRTPLALASLALLLVSGCAKLGLESESLINGSCQAAPDQQGSFMAKVTGFPITVIADSDFTQDEEQSDSIRHAVDQWNQLGHRLVGGDFFELSFGPIPDAARSGNPRDCSADTGGADESRFYIVHERSAPHWQALGFNDHIPGATIRCHDDTEVQHQVVFINTALIEDAQVGSVALHELGHSLGLDHSCQDGSGSADFRSCNGLSENHSYRLAVMYPTLRARVSLTEGPETKEMLQANDIMRAQCLYYNP